MKNQDSLENLLHSWAPRRPSARIEQELFGTRCVLGAMRTSPPYPRWPFHIRWQGAWGAAFATCVVVLFTAVNVSQMGRFSSAEAPWTMAALSNATTLTMAQHNTWTAPIFGWTNDRQLRSTIRSFDLLTTNRLLR